MKNYESPTIEPAGGTGNKVQPEAWIPIFFVLAIVVLDYVVAAQILSVTELVETSVAVHHTIATSTTYSVG
ncbi:MAG: hypothetical protein AUJ99_06285 [Caldisericum sp. CG2_30_36_11]|nr:MAG: hypothetical protein AUJ99_06285 [Caldisericum sp. CG2_30_36_11]